MPSRVRPLLAALLLALAALPARLWAQGAASGAGIPGLEGVDHVVIAVNDVRGAIGAYERLGFEVVATGDSLPGSVSALVDLGDAYLQIVSPRDSGGVALPYTFEGALGQAWRVSDVGAAASALSSRGLESDRPEVPGPVVTGIAMPRPQPVAGTEIVLVEVDEAARARLVRELAGIGSASSEEPEDHANGAVGLAYVTIAVRNPDPPVEQLRRWGLEPAEPVDDARGARSVRVDLPRGTVFVVAPLGGGGLADFLEERRAHSAPVGDRLYEGSILSVGVAVEDLAETVAFLEDRRIPHVGMELPGFGRTEVVQGAPGWGLRLEFVEAPGGSGAAAAAASGASCPSREDCE